MSDVAIAELVGQTFREVRVNAEKDEMVFVADGAVEYRFYHDQSCCERVRINDINGDLAFLIGEPLLLADESSSEGNEGDVGKLRPSEHSESWRWTFYRFGTKKGYVDVRWLGESNGYYSERVNLDRTP